MNEPTHKTWCASVPRPFDHLLPGNRIGLPCNCGAAMHEPKIAKWMRDAAEECTDDYACIGDYACDEKQAAGMFVSISNTMAQEIARHYAPIHKAVARLVTAAEAAEQYLSILHELGRELRSALEAPELEDYR